MNKNLKPINWLLKHALTVGSCVLIIVLDIVLLARSSPGPTTIGESITTGNLTATGTISEGGTLLSEKYADKNAPLPLPTITTISPTSTTENYPPFTVTITGTNFSKTGMSVKMGDTDLTDVNVSSLTSLTATVHGCLEVGTSYDVEVSNPYFQSGTGSDPFTIIATELPKIYPPIITSVPDADDGYVNAAEAADGIVVNGTATSWSKVRVYINCICVGASDTEMDGTFQVVVAKADLGADGAKTLYATATEVGMTGSDKSDEVNFTLDTLLW